MAKTSVGTSIVFVSTATLAQNVRITSNKTALDTTALSSLVTTAIGGRPTITGSATIFADQTIGLTLAQMFSEASPSGAPINITITSPITGIDYDGDAVITGFNPTWDTDAVMTAEVTWQYTGQIAATRTSS
jgi:hypothetical protein